MGDCGLSVFLILLRQLSVEQALLGEEGTESYVTYGVKLAVTLGGCVCATDISFPKQMR